ncbi:hypothetical protein [Candidatus Epulonipiscium viviparus]|uniref:hypothetical protein n=1 Tax=Candidatus Epulonipiscium viviparus TaxID=420336 RepID=UPI00016C0A39|nr:hypothetical protein [Candidatus Epulopiscium viviparus]
MNKYLKIMEDMEIELDLMDVSFLKACCVITGIIIGTVFPKTSKALRPLLMILWMCMFTMLILKIFIKPLQDRMDWNDEL